MDFEFDIMPDRPNVLFFMTDQHHADCLGFRGHPMVKTPNLDRLAAKSATFSQMFTGSAICSPSRTSFYTGQYLRSHGHYQNIGDLRDRDLPSLIDRLADVGYQTGQCGKDHLPPCLSKRFDKRWSMAAYRRDLAAAGIEDDVFSPLATKRFTSKVSRVPEAWCPEVWTADRAIQFLDERETNRPFFLWCSFDRPHAPHSPPAAFADLYDPDDVPLDWEGYERFEASRGQLRPMIEAFWNLGSNRQNPRVFQEAVCRHLALITLIDREIGRVLDQIDARGLADDTIVVFTADHGDWAGHYGSLGKNLPGYDHLLRVPFIYHDPHRPQDDGREVTSFYQTVDLMPSLLERVGGETPAACQGVSFLPGIDGVPGSGRDVVFAETSAWKTLRTREWKLNFCVRDSRESQLFAMGPSPDELTNHWDDPSVAHTRSDLMARMLEFIGRHEQPTSMAGSWEVNPDSRWYRWLAEQPREHAVSAEPAEECVSTPLPDHR